MVSDSCIELPHFLHCIFIPPPSCSALSTNRESSDNESFYYITTGLQWPCFSSQKRTAEFLFSEDFPRPIGFPWLTAAVVLIGLVFRTIFSLVGRLIVGLIGLAVGLIGFVGFVGLHDFLPVRRLRDPPLTIVTIWKLSSSLAIVTLAQKFMSGNF